MCPFFAPSFLVEAIIRTASHLSPPASLTRCLYMSSIHLSSLDIAIARTSSQTSEVGAFVQTTLTCIQALGTSVRDTGNSNKQLSSFPTTKKSRTKHQTPLSPNHTGENSYVTSKTFKNIRKRQSSHHQEFPHWYLFFSSPINTRCSKRRTQKSGNQKSKITKLSLPVSTGLLKAQQDPQAQQQPQDPTPRSEPSQRQTQPSQ